MNTSIHTKRILAALAVAVIASTALAGCGSEESWEQPGPEGALRAFLLDWFMFRHEQAFTRLSEQDREALERGRADLSAQVGEDAAPPVHQMLVGTAVASPYDLKKIERLDKLDGEPDEGAKVRLGLEYLDGREAQATMVWTKGQWYVALGVNPGEAKGK